MKLSALSTRWDDNHRAVPSAAPNPLSASEVYGVTASTLNPGGIIHRDHAPTDASLADARQLLPAKGSP